MPADTRIEAARCVGWTTASNRRQPCAGTGYVMPVRTGPDTWARGYVCSACQSAPYESLIEASLDETFPGLSVEVERARHDYHSLVHRQPLESALADWSRRRVLLAYGPCGSMKTVAVLRWAVARKLKGSSVCWVKGTELVEAFKMAHGREEASAVLLRARRATVLVIDEYQSKGGRNWTPNVADGMDDLVQARLDNANAVTVLVSNRSLDEVLGLHGDMVRSRFGRPGQWAYGEAVECACADVRGSM